MLAEFARLLLTSPPIDAASFRFPDHDYPPCQAKRTPRDGELVETAAAGNGQALIPSHGGRMVITTWNGVGSTSTSSYWALNPNVVGEHLHYILATNAKRLKEVKDIDRRQHNGQIRNVHHNDVYRPHHHLCPKPSTRGREAPNCAIRQHVPRASSLGLFTSLSYKTTIGKEQWASTLAI